MWVGAGCGLLIAKRLTGKKIVVGIYHQRLKSPLRGKDALFPGLKPWALTVQNPAFAG